MLGSMSFRFIQILCSFLTFGWCGSEVIHRIEKGESLYSIGKKYDVSSNEIMKVNGISDAKKVKIGQKLKIPVQGDELSPLAAPKTISPAPERYVVQRGESYTEIAQKFGLQESWIKNLNHNMELEAGVVLLLKEPKGSDKKKATLPPSDEEHENSKYLFIDSIKHLIDLPKIQRNRWKYIIVHHSATSSGNAAIFDLAHRQRGMENGLAYHFVVGNGHDTKDGEIEVGNRWLKQLQGGHLRSEELNQMAIGICLVGNFEESRPTRRQQAATIELISYLRKIVGKPYPEFRGHREINPLPTSCPGRHFPLQAFHRIFDRE